MQNLVASPENLIIFEQPIIHVLVRCKIVAHSSQS